MLDGVNAGFVRGLPRMKIESASCLLEQAKSSRSARRTLHRLHEDSVNLA
jgi:hypothetical protein